MTTSINDSVNTRIILWLADQWINQSFAFHCLPRPISDVSPAQDIWDFWLLSHLYDCQSLYILTTKKNIYPVKM